MENDDKKPFSFDKPSTTSGSLFGGFSSAAAKSPEDGTEKTTTSLFGEASGSSRAPMGFSDSTSLFNKKSAAAVFGANPHLKSSLIDMFEDKPPASGLLKPEANTTFETTKAPSLFSSGESIFGSNPTSVFGSNLSTIPSRSAANAFSTNSSISKGSLFGATDVKPFGSQPVANESSGSKNNLASTVGVTKEPNGKETLFGNSHLFSASKASIFGRPPENIHSLFASPTSADEKKDSTKPNDDVIDLTDQDDGLSSSEVKKPSLSIFSGSKDAEMSTKTKEKSKDLFSDLTSSSKGSVIPIIGSASTSLFSKPAIFGQTVVPSSTELDYFSTKKEDKTLDRKITSYADLSSFGTSTDLPETSKLAQAPKAEPKVIIATNIPDNFLSKSILKNHFSKFGTIVAISLHSKANQAQVTFTSHEAATLAKKKGKKLHPNISDLMIFFGQNDSNKKAADKSTKDSEDSVKTSKSVVSELKSKPSKDILPSNPLFKPRSVKSGSDWLKKKSEKPVTKRDYSNIPTDLKKVGKGSSRAESRKASPAPQTSLMVDNFSQFSKIRATNSKEKFDLLEVRDKFIRKLQTKEYDVNKAKYLSATCVDMCPEKERYMREVRNDLSQYEVTEDRKVCHERAVKKFSRSSADKDEPLPYELRTSPVLKRTIDYLLSNILPKMEEGITSDLDVCYNYLWDRTRAVRSDITQQHLVDQSAVYVLERCVRFHIFAAERLCNEPPDIFDAKMNTEHIQKSMQTLKELYHDLSLNDIYCDTEAEFRAYEILLNVYDGSVMFSYMLLRDAVQSSSEIQFALEVVNAIQTNNYVRFFKLTLKANFLQACIMHRYFNRIRSEALKVMSKAFKAITKVQSLKLKEVIQLLAFESAEDAIDFMSSHNFSLDSTGSKIDINRKLFVANPKTPAPFYRAVKLIQSKRNGLDIASIINGGTMPPNPLKTHTVQSSFSEDGYLIGTVNLIESLGKKEEIKTENVEATNQTVADKKTDISFDVKDKNITEDCVNEESVDVEVNESTKDELYDENNKDQQYIQENDADRYDENYDEGQYDENYEGEYDENYEEDQCDDGENYDDGYKDQEYHSQQLAENDSLSADVVSEVDEVKLKKFREMKDEKLVEKYFSSWKDGVSFNQELKDLTYILTDRASFENMDDWRELPGFENRELVLQKLYEFKLVERFADKWQTIVRKQRVLKAARAQVLRRRVISRWRNFIRRNHHRRYIKNLIEAVKINLRRSSLKKLVLKWRRSAYVSRVVRILKRKRRDRLQTQYFWLWFRNTQQRKWLRKSLTVGFPAAASRISLSEQNTLWQFNCGSKRTFSEIQNLEKDLVNKKAMADVRRDLEEKICNEPLPIQATLQKIIDSKNLHLKFRSKSFKALIVYDSSVSEISKNWIRMKLNMLCAVNKIKCSFKLKSAFSLDDYYFEFSEGSQADLGSSVDFSCYYFISDGMEKAESFLNFNKNGVRTDLVCIKMSEKDCQKAETSAMLLEKINSSYRRVGSLSKIVSGDLIHVAQSFVSKHVLQEFYNAETLVNEFGLSPLLPKCYTSLMNDIVEKFKAIFDNSGVRGESWRCVGDSDIAKMDDTKFNAIFSTLDTLHLTDFVENDLQTWSDSISSILNYIFNNITHTLHFSKLSSELIWFINTAKQEYILKNRLDEFDDQLPDILLLPWRKIFSALVSYKLCQLPSVKIIYSIDEIAAFKLPSDWYLPFISSLPKKINKRKLLHQNHISLKKHKPDKKLQEDIASEKMKMRQLEEKLERLVEGCDYDSLHPSSGSPPFSPDEVEILPKEDSDLKECIALEKMKWSSLENKLRMLI